MESKGPGLAAIRARIDELKGKPARLYIYGEFAGRHSPIISFAGDIITEYPDVLGVKANDQMLYIDVAAITLIAFV